MIRRQPLAVYRVIDEEELLLGGEAPEEAGEQVPPWSPMDSSPPLPAPRPRVPWRGVVLLGGMLLAAGGYALGGAGGSDHGPAVPALAAARPAATPRATARRGMPGTATASAPTVRASIPRATVMRSRSSRAGTDRRRPAVRRSNGPRARTDARRTRASARPHARRHRARRRPRPVRPHAARRRQRRRAAVRLVAPRPVAPPEPATSTAAAEPIAPAAPPAPGGPAAEFGFER